QVARALIEAAPSLPYVKALAAGRPALDVRDPRSIERAFGDMSPDVVINSAAYTAVDQAETDHDAAFALNRDGAALLARAAAKRNVPVIHLSTHYVFDGTKKSPYDEADAPCPATVYGRSKHEGERAVAEASPRHVIIRTGWVFSGTERGFVRRILAAGSDAAPLGVVDDQHGNPTYAPHLADAVLDVARQISGRVVDDRVWGTFHAAGEGAATWRRFAHEIAEAAASHGAERTKIEPITSSEYPCVATRPKNSELDCTKFDDTFSLRLPPWQQGVADCVSRLLSS
ncbi:MAG TPA: dTDP-4-dehydrorhamnose reductase, partial [Hyphomicrobium sp.]|nr:dTDP-4-dehydrorhamnose reductase [Hyphomicrobium sp.]